MSKNRELKFAVIGCGFWSYFQISAWKELSGVRLVAVCDQDESKARDTAQKFDLGERYYTDAQEMLTKEEVDFVDIITNPETHRYFVELAADYGKDAICQKPLAPDYDTAKGMVSSCEQKGIKLFVHENFRWQRPLRVLKDILDEGTIGKPFKARIMFCSSFPVFENQPFLAELDKFIISDVGTHVLDVARFLFGEVDRLTALTQRVNPKIKGEDVANVFLSMRDNLHCYVEMSYASILETESFPQTRVLVEGHLGSVEVLKDYEVRVTTANNTTSKTAIPPRYDWADPDYAVVHSSIVETNRNLLSALHGQGQAETTGSDNLKTLELVYAAYQSSSDQSNVKIPI
ncbi:MAG: Gfo/Idh/MocA family oxidoreductase [Cyclobacteriaceae bacterium]|nr:Gfo/Idh/MocA family oxidoreductase [Cyclobacteriaceae bacterium HetDA_MAG_MS6]